MKFPFVSCSIHPGPQRSYIICVHVLVGLSAECHLEATDQDSGELLCAACCDAPRLENLRLICAAHALDIVNRPECVQ